ncbi:hypothetical protein R50072_37110 [Simiduia litorea]|uniref:DUF2750 domain-containing protein n=1 Tax=Simiduia litorea TaxID=1435348 RepID=UPI0036F3709A
MSSAGAQANKFYEEVSAKREVWFAESRDGNALEFDVKDGKVSFPLWSSETRVQRIIKYNPELLDGFKPRKLSWDSFLSILVPILKDKRRMVGVNLSGKKITGFDMPVDSLIRQIESFN